VTAAYLTRPTRSRRTKVEIDNLKIALFELVEASQPMTCRQVFYRGIGPGYWHKTEADYKGVVCRLLADMRRGGELPYEWIVDETRYSRRPPTWSSPEAALGTIATVYRRNLWERQDTYVEVWLEKDALLGVLADITESWCVPFTSTRGYPSLSLLSRAAAEIAMWAEHRHVRVLYLGDHDPSGDDIARTVQNNLIAMSQCPIDFVRLAVTAEQIGQYDLPTRPTKRTDTRSRSWNGDESVEVDALPPEVLRELVEHEITMSIDGHQYDVEMAVEQDERDWLQRLVNREFTRR
jgi:hypothetical protein